MRSDIHQVPLSEQDISHIHSILTEELRSYVKSYKKKSLEVNPAWRNSLAELEGMRRRISELNDLILRLDIYFYTSK